MGLQVSHFNEFKTLQNPDFRKYCVNWLLLIMLFFNSVYLGVCLGDMIIKKFSHFTSPNCALFETAPSALVLDWCTTYIKDAQQHDGQQHQLQHVQLHEQPQQVNNFLNLNLQLDCQLLQLLCWQFWQMHNINSLTVLSIMKIMVSNFFYFVSTNNNNNNKYN